MNRKAHHIGCLYKSNQRQLLRADRRNKARSYVSGVIINSEYNLDLGFGDFAELSHFWDEDVLDPINKHYLW
jgi:hypothetical protein